MILLINVCSYVYVFTFIMYGSGLLGIYAKTKFGAYQQQRYITCNGLEDVIKILSAAFPHACDVIFTRINVTTRRIKLEYSLQIQLDLVNFIFILKIHLICTHINNLKELAS